MWQVFASVIACVGTTDLFTGADGLQGERQHFHLASMVLSKAKEEREQCWLGGTFPKGKTQNEEEGFDRES